MPGVANFFDLQTTAVTDMRAFKINRGHDMMIPEAALSSKMTPDYAALKTKTIHSW